MKQMDKADAYTSDILTQLAQSTPVAMVAKINRQMALAVRIADAIKDKGWSQKDFSDKMGKKPSEISRWLSGCHNFTTDTIWKIEDVLNIHLLLVEVQDEVVTV